MRRTGPVLTVTLNPAIDKTVTLPAFEYGGLNRVQQMRVDAGGKGINVAKVLNSFGIPVEAWGFAAGHQGNVIREKLNAAGIPSKLLETPGETRVNLKIVDESTKETTELNEPGVPVDEETLQRFESEFKQAAEQASVVVLGGSLPPGAPPDYYQRLIELANEQGAAVILDADGEALAAGVKAVPYAIKPNIHELERLVQQKLDSAEAIIRTARTLTDRGITCVLVSMGGDGSLLITAEQAIAAKPFPITPQSTVGAGDSMVAALVYGILQELDAEAIARWTSAAGTVTASKPGTQVCTLDEVKESLSKVPITHELTS